MTRAFALLLAVVSQLALAQSYPSKPIRLVVGLAPGGATDIMARTLTPALGEELGQPVVVDNRPGAAGSIGAGIVAKSPPDGYTLFLASSSFTSNVVLAKQPAYDPIADFEPITNVAAGPFLLVVRNSLPVKSVQELIDYAKANPDKLSYGSAGAGTLTNLAGELFKQLIGVPGIVHIPYKGSAPGVADLASGQIPMMTPNVGAPLLAFHRAGKVRILAINSATRIKAAPDIPTAAESGLPGMIAGNLNGLFAPAGVARTIVDQIAEATRKIVANAEAERILVASGFEPVLDSGPAATRGGAACGMAAD